MGIMQKDNKNKKRVVVSVINDLVSDNRVHKVATSLLNNNYDVLVIGRKLKTSQELTREYKTKRMKLIFNKSALFYAEFNMRLFFKLLFIKTDILLANDLDTLSANFLVSKIKRKKLVYDSHELFTELPELQNRKLVQKVWIKLERWIFPKLKYVYTVCDSISEYYNQKYGVNVNTIRNVPFCNDFNFPATNEKSTKIILYQGAINIGRGIEEAIEAMNYLNGYELWIIGEGEIFKEIKQSVYDKNLADKIKIFGRIRLEDLIEYTVKADLGLSLEKNLGLNYYYALPNKIFDYINAGVPILCSDLPEMKKIVQGYDVGEVLKENTPKQIATQIMDIFEKNKTATWKTNIIKAKKELCWQKEEKILIEIFNK